jgi:phosphoglycerol transferase
MKSARRALPYVVVALAASTVLFLSLRLGSRDLRVPFVYGGDGLFYTILAKAISQEGFLHFERLGAPFGMDLFDWPTGMLLDFSLLALLTRAFGGEAGTAVNTYWLTSVVLTAVVAAWCFRRLLLPAPVALPLGLLYGLLPYAFYRNVLHLSLVFHFVPLLCLLLLRIASGRPAEATRAERVATAAACLLQGLSYPYYGLFAAMLAPLAGALGCLRARALAPARAALVGLAFIGLGMAINLAPSAAYWRLHGSNPELEYKSPADSDGYGLKIRQLVTPSPESPLPPLRWVAARIAAVPFPLENENATSRLGLVASLGFLALLAVSLTAGSSVLRDGLAPLHAAAALNLAAVLVATVGGVGSIFAVFVTTAIRAWNRIAVFNAFFGLFTAGVMAAWILDRAARRSRVGARVAPAAACVVLGLCVLEQVPAGYLEGRREEDEARWHADEAFGRKVESLLPRGGLVFQLPHTPTPLDASSGAMLPYDNAGAYLHSRTLSWSWGAISGRHGNWQDEVARLPPREMAERLAAAGFAAVWVDRNGWAPWGRSRYAHTDRSPEDEIASVAGQQVYASRDSRYAVVPLTGLAAALRDVLGPERFEEARAAALGVPAVVRWPRGFAVDPRRPAVRRAQQIARLAFRNGFDRERTMDLAARLRALAPGGGRLQLSGLVEETLVLGTGAHPWRGRIRLPPRSRGRIDLAFEPASGCPAEAGSAWCYEVIGMVASWEDAAPIPGSPGKTEAGDEP